MLDFTLLINVCETLTMTLILSFPRYSIPVIDRLLKQSLLKAAATAAGVSHDIIEPFQDAVIACSCCRGTGCDPGANSGAVRAGEGCDHAIDPILSFLAADPAGELHPHSCPRHRRPGCYDPHHAAARWIMVHPLKLSGFALLRLLRLS